MLRQFVWRPDVVWVVEPSLFCAPTGWLVARLCGARAWLHVQDYEVDAAFELGLLKGAAVRRAVGVWENRLMRRFDPVSTISQRMLARARAKGVELERLILFPNWVDLATVTPPLGPNPLRTELGVPSDAIVALYSGTMGRKRKWKLLPQVAARLEDTPNLLFVFCGNGAGREELVAGCEGLPNVRFMDLQPLENLGALLGMADIHLLPQQAEAADLVMPSKLTGMLGSGRPVVATCAEGTEIADVVRGHGVIVPPGDADSFAAAVRELADRELRDRLGTAARSYARNRLSRERVLTRFERALEEKSRTQNCR